jgi:hypothetical protein
MVELPEFLRRRRDSSRVRLESFRSALKAELERDRDELIGNHTAVYVVGSGGRDELSEHSDLDLFLVREHGEPRRVDEVRLQSAIVHALDAARFKRPSDDARFLKLHAGKALIERLGAPIDDWENTFTVRMLLLLESKALVGHTVHESLLRKCVSAYWKNTKGHLDDYLPIVLVNDIVRYWRILLLNYESKSESERLKPGAKEADLEADKRLRSCKLRCSRSLMCYASVAFLLAETHATRVTNGRACVQLDVVERMATLTPIERLRAAVERVPDLDAAQKHGAKLLELYAAFLEAVDREKSELLALFGDPDRRKPLLRDSEAFGQTMFELLQVLGQGNPLYRYVVL